MSDSHINQDTVQIRPLNPASDAEVALVASRMRLTLIEVVGEERGAAMYTTDWLEARVRHHLDPAACTGAVFLAERGGEIVGHTIVREEPDGEGGVMGLFSTTYVAPGARRQGVASALVRRGEAWMRARGLERAATATGEHNARLLGLFGAHGYEITLTEGEMVLLGRALSAGEQGERGD